VSSRPDPQAGVFDTLVVQAGEPVALAPHLDRLATSVRELYDVVLDVTALGGEVSATAAATRESLQRVRVAFVPGRIERVAGCTVASSGSSKSIMAPLVAMPSELLAIKE